jgi:hypothetical protein
MTIRWTSRPGLAIARSEDRVALIDPKGPDLVPLILEDAAAFLWGAIEAGATSAELQEAATAVGIPMAHLEGFLADLDRRGVITQVSE